MKPRMFLESGNGYLLLRRMNNHGGWNFGIHHKNGNVHHPCAVANDTHSLVRICPLKTHRICICNTWLGQAIKNLWRGFVVAMTTVNTMYIYRYGWIYSSLHTAVLFHSKSLLRSTVIFRFFSFMRYNRHFFYNLHR